MLLARSGVILCLALLGSTTSGCNLIDDIVDEVHGPSTGGGGPVTPPPPGGAMSCFGGGSASGPSGPGAPAPDACKTADEFKQQASDICAASKANLVDLKLTQPC